MKKSEKQLLGFFRAMSEDDGKSLLAFAEFLALRSKPVDKEVPPPEEIARPLEESVVAALKRLSASYHMLDKDKVFNETSVLMTQHIMQGREAKEVIDELETIFQHHYEKLIAQQKLDA